MRRSLLILALTGLAGLLGDGGSRTAMVRAGLTSASPPIPATAPAAEVERELLRGSPRRAWSAFLSRLGRRPFDLSAAVGLVEAAERTGRLEIALEQVAALRRRRDAAALQIAEMELRGLHVRGSGTGSGVFGPAEIADRSGYAGFLRVAVAMAAGDLAAVWRAVAAVESTEILEAVSPRTELLATISRRTLLRRRQLHALIGRPTAVIRDLTRLRWAARVLGARRIATRLDLLLAVRAPAAGDAGRAVGHADSALRESLGAGDNATTYLTLAAVRSRDNPRSHWGGSRFPPRLCALVSPDSVRLRRDCRLTALEHAWKGGELEMALRLYETLAEAGESGHPVLRARLASLAVPLLKTIGRFSEARDLAASALADAEEIRDATVAWRLRTHLASIARVDGDAAAAAGWLDAAGPGIDLPASVRVGVELERARVAALQKRSSDVSRYLDRAADLAADGVARRLVLLTRVELLGLDGRDPRPAGYSARLPGVAHGPVDALANAVIRGRMAEERGELVVAREHYRGATRWVSEVIRATEDRELRRALVTGWRQLIEAQARISLRLGDPSAALEAIVALEGSTDAALHVRRHLSEREAVLVFRTIGRDVWCWLITSDEIRASRVPARAERLRDLVSLWSVALRRGGDGGVWREVGMQISRAVLHPLRAQGARQRWNRLTVVTRGAIGSIPFDVLPVGRARDRLLGDRYVVSRAGSLALLDAAWHQEPRVGPAVAFGPGGSAAVLAEVAHALRRRPGFAFTGPRATETRFVERAAESGLIHFGGHALAPAEDLDGGGLVLRSTLMDDGLLSYREITALDLRGASVVLLACDTAGSGVGMGGSGPSERPGTLAEAFLLAGSRSVVGSLWPLSEAAAGEIAEAFYAAGGPEGGPDSLAIAKRVLRRRYPDSPERWAGAVWEGAPLAAPR